MKYAIGTLLMATLLLWGFNIGLESGLRAKPVLDMSKCSTVIRYEDNSLSCQPDGHIDTLEVVAGDTSSAYQSTFNPQKTQDSWVIQPAKTEDEWQL